MPARCWDGAVPIGTDAIGLHLTDESINDAGVNVNGEFSVGTYYQGSDAIFGEGDDHVVGMAVFSNTNIEAGAWADNTTDAVDGTPFPLFQGTGTAQTAFFGGLTPFPSLDVTTTLAMIPGTGTWVWEYWNGVSWVTFNVMAADAEAPHEQYANDVFQRLNHEHIRFADLPGWATRMLNGATRYWVRMRLTSPITQVPQLDQVKLGTNHTAFNEDGAEEWVWTAEKPRVILDSRQTQYTIVGSAPGSNNISFSPNITLNYTNNRMVDGATDAFGFVIPVPIGLDTSRNLRFVISWFQDNNSLAGNVQFILRYAQLAVGTLLNGTAAESTTSIIVPTPANQYQLVHTELALAVPSLLPGEEFVFTITRDATGGNPSDTYAGNVSIVNFALYGTFWR